MKDDRREGAKKTFLPRALHGDKWGLLKGPLKNHEVLVGGNLKRARERLFKAGPTISIHTPIWLSVQEYDHCRYNLSRCYPDDYHLTVIYFSVCSPTAESFGVSAKLGPGALWGSHPARFWSRGSKSRIQELPRFQVRVPSKGPGRFQVRVPSQGFGRL